MAILPCNQLSLANVFSDCQDIYESDKPEFLSLLQSNIDLDEIIPDFFQNRFYASMGISHKYPLHAFLWALIIQRIFSIPTVSLLLVFLKYSRHLREFCDFDKVPDAPKITHFKQDFLSDLQLVFDNLVDVTKPICQAIDSAKADMTIFDSVGLYKSLLASDTFGESRHFLTAYIPLNSRSHLENVNYKINKDGIPCCPKDEAIPMKYECISKLRSGVLRYKFVCPKMIWEYNPETKRAHRKCICNNPCTDSNCGRMIYSYPEKNLRTYLGTLCGTSEWDSTYKIRTTVELPSITLKTVLDSLVARLKMRKCFMPT